MSPGDDHDSVFDEPHLRPEHQATDPSEERARRILEREAALRGAADAGGESVYDEPDILPGRPDEVIDQDWGCSVCGYNLRGLKVGHRCPECGHIELYRPPPSGADAFSARFERNAARTSRWTGWWVAGAAIVPGGVFAIFGALMESLPAGATAATLLLAVVFAPVVEETLKIAAAAIVVERRPWLFRSVDQIRLATVGAAAVFAIVENLIYLNIYLPSPTPMTVAWRWTVCVALHVGCTLVASNGVARVWQRTNVERRPPRITDCAPMLTAAIILHAFYNLSVITYEISGRPFG